MTITFSMDNILVLSGVIIMTYATYRGYMLYRLFASPTAWYSMGGALTRTWRILLVLIVFFLLAYIGYFIMQLMSLAVDPSLLVGIVFLFGAIFVLMNVNLSYKTYSRFAPKKQNETSEDKNVER